MAVLDFASRVATTIGETYIAHAQSRPAIAAIEAQAARDERRDMIIYEIVINGQRYPSDGRGLCLCKCCKGKDCYATETKGSFALINGNRCYDSKYACISMNCAKQFPTMCSLHSNDGNILAECRPMIS
ncbi:unnamed protein product [Rotaria sordida]|uniref:Uncharacterized protein n=1 Tax=Rotaria sordida TaxID=392033 RepID=A0A814LUQ3_9BILA|nr:unnamed protein product [Rotaria sordida]CAF1347358.1 unnamed protein product [Rotaria sordida]